jgi:hypothetical protein
MFILVVCTCYFCSKISGSIPEQTFYCQLNFSHCVYCNHFRPIVTLFQCCTRQKTKNFISLIWFHKISDICKFCEQWYYHFVGWTNDQNKSSLINLNKLHEWIVGARPATALVQPARGQPWPWSSRPRPGLGQPRCCCSYGAAGRGQPQPAKANAWLAATGWGSTAAWCWRLQLAEAVAEQLRPIWGRGLAGRASAAVWQVAGGKTKYKIVECNGETQNAM